MCYNAILFRYFIENFLPDDIREAVPIVYVMREVLNQNRVRSRLAVKTDFGLKGLATCQTNPDQAKQEDGILEQHPGTDMASNRQFLSDNMEVADGQGDHELQANRVEMDVPQEMDPSRVVPSENRESISTFRLRPRRLETEGVNPEILQLS